jgi:hypothetical protein
MKITEIRNLFAAAHSALSAESIAFLAQDTATVLGPVLAKMQEAADIKATFRKGTESKDAGVKLVSRAAAEVGAHPLLCHLSFVLGVASSFERHGVRFEGMNLPLSFGVRVRAAAPTAAAPTAAAPTAAAPTAAAPTAAAPTAAAKRKASKAAAAPTA